MRYEDAEKYMRALNLLRHELSWTQPAVAQELRACLVNAQDPERAVWQALEIVRCNPDVRMMFMEVLWRVDPGLPFPESPTPGAMPPGGGYSPTVGAPMPNTGTYNGLAGDVTPTPALDLVCPNDPSHPGARVGVFNRLMPPKCPYCKVRLVDRRS